MFGAKNTHELGIIKRPSTPVVPGSEVDGIKFIQERIESPSQLENSTIKLK